MGEFARGPDRPVRIGQRRAAEKHEIDQFIANDTIGYGGQAEIPAHGDGNADLALDAVAADVTRCVSESTGMPIAQLTRLTNDIRALRRNLERAAAKADAP